MIPIPIILHTSMFRVCWDLFIGGLVLQRLSIIRPTNQIIQYNPLPSVTIPHHLSPWFTPLAPSATLTVWVIMFIPLKMGFDWESDGALSVSELIMDGIFLFDCVMNFRTSYTYVSNVCHTRGCTSASSHFHISSFPLPYTLQPPTFRPPPPVLPWFQRRDYT